MRAKPRCWFVCFEGRPGAGLRLGGRSGGQGFKQVRGSVVRAKGLTCCVVLLSAGFPCVEGGSVEVLCWRCAVLCVSVCVSACGLVGPGHWCA